MLSRGVDTYLQEYGYDYPYEDVRELFLSDDLTIGNLECPITDSGNPADKTKRFLFRADVENAAALKRAGFDCLNLANNHSMDYLSKGLLDTMNHLESSGLAYVGAAENASTSTAYTFEKNGIKVGILAYSAFPPEGFFYNKDEPTVRYISTMDLSGLEADLASLECDFKMVYFHWGVEYLPYKSEIQEQLARTAVDSGADFVVGTHPHVLQEKSIYKDTYIYYSLGNFIFDSQIPPGTDESMIVQLTVGKEGLVDIAEIPLVIKRGKPSGVGTQSSQAAEIPMEPEETTESEEITEPEETKKPKEASEPDETIVAETLPLFLESLSGLEAGTVIAADRLDFSNIDNYFMFWEIEEGDNLHERINGKSYQINDSVPLSALRYLKMPHYNYNGEIQVGEMIVNKEIQEDVFNIFKELFMERYQIQSMYLIDNYWTGDSDTTDAASIDVNNTSAFCFRQISGGSKLSNHAYGKAIDINPQQNPYVSYSSGSAKWFNSNANDYIKRDTGLSHMITHDDLAYKVFKKYGFQWGGDWSSPKDYQHFEKK